jgi:SPP1 family predicted phage head-tail adaptor
MRAGLLNKKITFLRYAYEANAYGDRKKTYTSLGSPWANVRFVGSPSEGASEEVDNNQITGKIKIEVMCRYFDGIRFDDAIKYNDAIYEIYSIQEIGVNEGLRIRAQLRDDLQTVTLSTKW